LSNHDLFWIIADPGHQKSTTLSVESNSTIAFQAGTSYVKFPEWGQHSSNRGMPCLISIFGTIWGTGDQPSEDLGALCRCPADIFSNIPNCEIQRAGMLIPQKIGQMSLLGCTNDWHNCPSGRKLILCIEPPITRVHLTVYSATF